MSRRLTVSRSTPRIGGNGLHTGEASWIAIHPAEIGLQPGFRFRSETGSEILLGPESVIDTRRCTVINIGGRRFGTVEHVLSALVGLGVTDALVEVSGPEAPILDGSAAGFCAAISEAGLTELAGDLDTVSLGAPIDICGRNGERIVALPNHGLRVTVVIEYPDKPGIGCQAASFSWGDDYAREVAPARTYGFLSELEPMRSAGLALGASLENCLSLADDGSADARTPLRFGTEPARHKLLDVIGDLALVGRPVNAHVVALRPSHAVNSALAARLAAL